MPCDVCRRQYADDDDADYELELEQCEDCGWSVCEDCSTNPSRGQCRCLHSNMGHAYSDMEPQWYMGSNGGAQYVGPFKCKAQREMEATLLMDRVTGGMWLTECGNPDCSKQLSPAESKLCTRCRSAIYCSAACQRAAWTTARGQQGAHKDQCGEYCPPETWPYISRDFQAYFEHWKRYPTAKPSPAQRASSEQLERESIALQAAADEAYRQRYLHERDAMLQQMELSDLAHEVSPPPQSPSRFGSSPTPAGPADRQVEAAERAATLLGGNRIDMLAEVNDADLGEMDPEIPIMNHAEVSARAQACIDQLRRDVGRERFGR